MQVLGRAMREQDWCCHFALTDTGVMKELEQEDFAVSYWSGSYIEFGPVDVLIVDGYSYSPELLAEWQPHAAVRLVIDDMAERPVSADMVLNHNIYGHLLDYSAYDVSVVIAGPDFSLVNQQFIPSASSSRSDPNQLLISFGGTDDGRYSVPVAEGIIGVNSTVKCHLVCSPLCAPSAALSALEDQHPGRVQFHHGADMADLMGRCSVMVGAAGYSLIEALVAGVRPVVCATADNQRLNVQAFQKLGGRALGYFDCNALVELTQAEFELPHDQKAICDGNGATRVIKSIKSVMAESARV